MMRNTFAARLLLLSVLGGGFEAFAVAIANAAELAGAVARLSPGPTALEWIPNERHVGFIAEEVPDLVASPDRKTLSPMGVVAVLTRVVQEQEKRIAELEAALADLSHGR